MMDEYGLDPYEQQLLKVFNSHDRENCGSLDREGLTQLCQTLQLDEHGLDLVKCLLKDKRSRVNFTDFKDALLALLGNMQNNKSSVNDDNIEEKSSPDREVSPKFVYGSKKYGRRSRPRNEDIHKLVNEDDKPQSISVQRSNSNTEVSSKKRKTNYRLQRCTSLPTNNDLVIEDKNINSHLISNDTELICTEEMLREAWKKLGVGEDGYLNQTELILVCDAIGLHKLADGVIRQLSDKLTVNCDHKISFQELLTILQQDDTWFEVLNHTIPTKDVELDGSLLHQSSECLFPDSRTFHLVTLGPDGNGMINTDDLIEMWESVGVHSPKELLHELGFNCRMVNILDLADVLDKQTKGITEATRSDFQSPHIALLQASLTLYQSEIKTFKNLLEQMHAEREKLKCHVTDANNRATLLAQEVDDNHSRMEQNTLNQVKLIEQRHSDILKEITAQFTKEKDHITTINQTLEDKISTLEQEVNKLKNDLSIAQKYSLNVEKENQGLSLKIAELERDRSLLSGQIDVLENEKLKLNEMGQEENKVLMAKLSTLQMENAQLKDKNDEMVSEIESLSNKMASMRMKVSSTPTTVNTLDQSMEENISIICEGVGLGAKRRSDYSPSKDNLLFGIGDSSPRLGKIRKFHTKNQDNFEVPFTSSESGFDTEVDCPDSPLCDESSSENEELTRLQSKVAFLEQILKQNGIPVPNTGCESLVANWSTNPEYLYSRVQELEKLIRDIKEAMRTMIEKDNINCDTLKKVSETLEKSFLRNSANSLDAFKLDSPQKDCACASSQTDFIDEFEAKVAQLEAKNKDLCAKCADLENCVELLRNEYEKCEDYWQNKVDEERQMYEAEQKVNSDKLADLIIKMKEYEEQFTDQDLPDGRLPTIEETYHLEKQFTDLEEEFEVYKEESETKLLQKDEEIAFLKEKLTELALKQAKDVAVQVELDTEEIRILNKMQNLSCYVIENTSRYPEEMMPPSPQIQSNASYMNQSLVWNQQGRSDEQSENCKSLPVSWSFDNKTESNGPSTSCSTTSLDKNSTPCTPCRPKRTKKYNKNIYKKNVPEKDDGHRDTDQRTGSGSQNSCPNFGPEQKIVIPLRSFHNLNARRNFLEQRVRSLQVCLQQQKYCHEQMMQHFWHQFSGEQAETHSKLKYYQEKLDQQVRINREQLDKLEKTDMLVKDLYVENSYLIASKQRLEEQRCHMLAHCNSNSV
ncbi:ninein [Diabrotica virgifera virgifera]|uniref:EF-hand domain-containing protein n=1 Tax=Diabrotica virgifera virgifera TaxID=50390 RepID=A0ABM5K259_DIAVI|nr:ninein [Diabrotica virgifera virgifera]